MIPSPLESCETVRVQMTPSEGNPSGVVVINKSDFVEGEHTLFEGQTAEEIAAKAQADLLAEQTAHAEAERAATEQAAFDQAAKEAQEKQDAEAAAILAATQANAAPWNKSA